MRTKLVSVRLNGYMECFLTAFFKVGAMLAAPEVVVSPPLAEVNKFLSKMVKSLVESLGMLLDAPVAWLLYS